MTSRRHRPSFLWVALLAIVGDAVGRGSVFGQGVCGVQGIEGLLRGGAGNRLPLLRPVPDVRPALRGRAARGSEWSASLV